jgi:hypothetical protein
MEYLVFVSTCSGLICARSVILAFPQYVAKKLANFPGLYPIPEEHAPATWDRSSPLLTVDTTDPRPIH